MPADPTFRMTVQEVFSIKGRGTVVTGRIESGTLSVGDEIRIQKGGLSRTVVVSGVEINRKALTRAQAGDMIGALFKDLEQGDIQQGDALTGSDLDFSWKP
ncbi:MAG: Elongation factor Tu [Anaerolineales bacterium]|nr:Elongation factor Tu [Anaerolineales bacterium]